MNDSQRHSVRRPPAGLRIVAGALRLFEAGRLDDMARAIEALRAGPSQPFEKLLAALLLSLADAPSAAIELLHSLPTSALVDDVIVFIAQPAGLSRDLRVVLTRHLDEEPGRAARYERAVRHLEKLGLFDEAAELAAGVDPLRRARLFERAGRFDEAHAEISRLTPDVDAPWPGVAALLVDLGRYAEAQAVLRPHEDHPDATRLIGTMALRRGDARRARESAEALLARAPDDASALALLGAALQLGGQNDAALELLDRVLGTSPGDAEALAFKTLALISMRRWEEAFKSACEARDLMGEVLPFAVLHSHLRALRQTAESDAYDHRAWLDLDGAATVLPEFGEALGRSNSAVANLLPELLARFGGNFTDRPTMLAPGTEDGVKRLARTPTVRTEALRIQQMLHALPASEVLDRLERLASTRSDAAFPLTYGGEVLLWLGRYDEARQWFERALERDPSVRWAWIGLGACHNAAGHPERALADYHRSIRGNDEGPSLRAYRGESRRLAGDLAGAREDLELACRSHPTRIGTWLQWTLLLMERNEPGLTPALEHLDSNAPALVYDTVTSLGLPATTRLAGLAPDTRRAAIDRAVDLMRGNRSSGLVTWFTVAGRLRTQHGPTLRSPTSVRTVRSLLRIASQPADSVRRAPVSLDDRLAQATLTYARSRANH